MLLGFPLYRFLFMGFRLRLGDIIVATVGVLIFALGVLADLIVRNHKKDYLPPFK